MDLLEQLMKLLVKVAPLILGLTILAALVESFLEHLVVPALKRLITDEEMRILATKWAAGLLGIFGCAVFGIDILSKALELLDVTPDYPPFAHWFGIVMTGLLVARGAQGIHDFAVRHLGLDGGKIPPFIVSGQDN